MSAEMRTYSITVRGHNPVEFVARTPGQARARAYCAYLSGYDCSFRDFLGISTIMRVPNRDPVGQRIIVGGQPATHCGFRGQYVQFMRDGSDIVLDSHPDDVRAITMTVADIDDRELLGRAVNSARPRRSRGKQPRWTAVMDALALGSTYARQLCRRFGLDPDEMVAR